MANTFQQTARNTFYVSIAWVVQFIIGLFLMPLLTKTLGVHSYGIWSQVHVTVDILLPFTGLGLVAALVRFLAAENNRVNIQEGFYSILMTTFMVSAIVSAVVFVLSSPIAAWFFDGETRAVQLASGILFASALEAIYLNLIRTFQQIKKYSLLVISENISRFGFTVYLVLAGQDILSVILALLAVKVVMIVVLVFLIRAQVGFRVPRFNRMREFLALSLPTVPRRMGVWLVNFGDRYIISYLLGVTSVGFYSAAYGLGSIPYSIVSILTFVLLVPLSRYYDEGKLPEVRTYLRYSVKYFLAIAIPFVFGAAILGEPVLEIFSTSRIAQEGRYLVPVLALAITLLGLNNLINNILFLVKKTGLMAYIWMTAAVLNLGLNILLVPRIGIMGAAVTTLIAYAVSLGLTVYFSFREFRFEIDWLFISKSLAASAVMAGVVWLISPRGLALTLPVVAGGVLIYGGIILALKGFSREEFRFLRGVFRRNSAGINAEDDVNIS